MRNAFCKNWRHLFLLIGSAWLVGCQTAERGTYSASKTWTRPSSGEFRGAWIYDPRRFDPDEVISTLKNAGFNAVFVRLSSAGAAYYPSKVLPKAPGTTRDYAQAYVDAGRKYGVRVHAWHVCFMMHYAPTADIKSAIKNGEVMRNTRGQAVRPTYNVPVRTPALAANRQLESDAAVELITQYSLDGVQLDYIRYFSPSVDYSATSRDAFEKAIDTKVKKWPQDVTEGRLKDRYHQWKTDLISSVVRDVSEAIKKANSRAKVSAAVWHSPKVGLRDYCQNWPEWVQKGYLDFVVPMNYTEDGKLLKSWVEDQKELVNGRIPLYAGLGSYMLNWPEQLNQQIDLCRQYRLPGYVLYNYDERLKTRFLPEIQN